MSLSPQSPLSLDEAAETLLRGLVKASTLRAAAERGELATERLGRRIVTTPADIEAWRMRCREQQRERACISGQRGIGETGASRRPPAGSSETGGMKLAQAAALAKAKKLKDASPPTSPANTRQTAASVHYLKSKSQT